jgi:hypothetical protein
MRRVLTFTTLVLGALALTLVATATANRGDDNRKNRSGSSAVKVFDLELQPKQEVPPVRLRARGEGLLTLDVTRDSSGAITSGEVIFYVNYDFPGSVSFTGLHVHNAARGVNGPIVVDSGIAAFTDADGDGNVTSVVTGVSPTLLQAILARPRDYYVNFHTSVNPSGAMRDQLGDSKRKRGKKHDD